MPYNRHKPQKRVLAHLTLLQAILGHPRRYYGIFVNCQDTYPHMQYMGGKRRIATKIVHYLESIRQPDQTYLEPFVGAGNIISRMSGNRIGSDIHEDLILLLKGVQDGMELPDFVSEEEYDKAKLLSPSIYRGFIGFGCSYGGKWFGGYARDHKGRNYAKNCKNSLLRKRPGLQDVELFVKDYREYNPQGYLIYCDPPYKDTTGYKDKFDSDEFWEVIKRWSICNTVIISEYSAPNGFECILEIPTRLDMQDGKVKHRHERLFSR